MSEFGIELFLGFSGKPQGEITFFSPNYCRILSLQVGEGKFEQHLTQQGCCLLGCRVAGGQNPSLEVRLFYGFGIPFSSISRWSPGDTLASLERYV